MEGKRVLTGRAALLLWVAAGSGPGLEHFQYERAVAAEGGTGWRCAVLDAAVFAHAAPGLKDLRLLTGSGREVPYVLVQSGTVGGEGVFVPAEHMVRRGRVAEFDLPMPRRPYTDVTLTTTGGDFVAEAQVSASGRALGTFSVFDLREVGQGENTVLHLQETEAPRLHVTLRAAKGLNGWAGMTVTGATVPPSREAQTLFTPVVTAAVEQQGGAAVARLALPRRVPVERVRVVLRGGVVPDFSREVEVQSRADEAGRPEVEETIAGSIERVHTRRDGVLLDAERLSVPATLGTNLQKAAEVTVTVRDRGGPVLPITGVVLEMRQRQMCFERPDGAESLVLAYGDARLTAPDAGARRPMLRGAVAAGEARLGPEVANPGYRAAADERTLEQRHPRMLSMLLAIALCGMSLVVFRSAGRLRL